MPAANDRVCAPSHAQGNPRHLRFSDNGKIPTIDRTSRSLVASPEVSRQPCSSSCHSASSASDEPPPTPRSPQRNLIGNGIPYPPLELARGADGAMTGFAFPEVLVDVYECLDGDRDWRGRWTSAIGTGGDMARTSTL
jgi:hypothetical protein